MDASGEMPGRHRTVKASTAVTTSTPTSLEVAAFLTSSCHSFYEFEITFVQLQTSAIGLETCSGHLFSCRFNA